jgi:hypothetical protein
MEISHRGFEKQADKLTAEQLDRPVDEVVAPPKEAEAETPAESVPESPVETKPEPEAPAPEPQEEKVPKSRFLTMSQRAIQAERALRTYEAEQANKPEPVQPIGDDAELKKHYTDLFGESEITDKLYKAELARLTSIEEKAAERAYERFTQREQVEEQLVNQRVQSFDSAFEELALIEGKTEFSDAEQVAMLDIVEEYSPKDKDGRLIGEYLLPLDKAYEIYKLNQEPVVQAKKQDRNAVAALQGARSQGTPSSTSDADWQPGQDRRWWNKI